MDDERWTMNAQWTEEELAGENPRRRMFIDATVTEEYEGLERVFHSAEKHSANPILTPEMPWEGVGVVVGGTIMQQDGKLAMRYKCWNRGYGATCLAESADGVVWERPKLGLVDYEGSRENNIIPGGGGCIIETRNPKSERDRWALFSYGEGGGRVVFSEDAVNWRKDEAKAGLFKTSDVVNFFYDPYENRYVSTYKTSNRRHRAVGIALSKDGLEWSKPVDGAVFGADDLDPDDTQIYGMPVFPYQGMYVGLPWIYHARWMKYGVYDTPKKMYEAQEGSPCTVDVQMAWSWDLISWNRTPGRKPFIALGEAGSWEWGMIYTARNPIIVGDKLYFYYYGCDNIHDKPDDTRCAIGLATLRLDGFCSMRAGEDEGRLISRREVFRTPQVAINARCAKDGFIAAELLDRNNNIIPGFSRDDCVPFSGDSTNHMLDWKAKRFPAELTDEDKKVRFFVRNADLYSYLPADIDTERDQGNRSPS